MTTHRPAPLSAGLAVVAATVAVSLVATTTPQRATLLVAVVGLALLAAGLESVHRGHRLLGASLALVGAAVVGGSLALGYRRLDSFSRIVELVPGLVGLSLLGLGLGPLWAGRERLLFSVGTGLVVVTLLVSGALYETTTGSLLIAGILTVLAWDLAEQAVNLGEQVGREARSYRVELVHGGATLAVGGTGIVLTRGISGANVEGLSLLVLAGLLAAAFTLMVALYN